MLHNLSMVYCVCLSPERLELRHTRTEFAFFINELQGVYNCPVIFPYHVLFHAVTLR